MLILSAYAVSSTYVYKLYVNICQHKSDELWISGLEVLECGFHFLTKNRL